MKNLFILSIFLFVSCSKDEQECTCKKAKFTYFTEGYNTYMYKKDVKINCETGNPIGNTDPKLLYIGCED